MPGGRPPKLTKLFLGTFEEQARAVKDGDVGTKILKAIESGCSREEACAYVRLPRRTLERWLERGNGGVGRSLYAEFHRRFHEGADRGVAMVTQGLAARALSDATGKVAMFFLEKRSPERWGRKVKMEIDGRVVSANVNAYLDLRKTLTDDRAQLLVNELLSLAGEVEPSTAGAGDDPRIQGPEALGNLGRVLSIVGKPKDPKADGQPPAAPREKLAAQPNAPGVVARRVPRVVGDPRVLRGGA